MSPNAKAVMSASKRLWNKIARFVEALEGIDDPMADYILSLGKRLEKLEHAVEHLETQRHPRPGGGGIQQ
jgi:hypothetical protein